MEQFQIGNKLVGKNQPVFIIAELSANHIQDFDIAVKTLEAAKEAGADAFKVSTDKPDTLTVNCDNDYFRVKGGTLWEGQTLYELYEKTWMPWEWHEKLKKIALDLGLEFFSTPGDKEAVDYLEKLGVPAYKISSFEITDIPLIEYVASKKKPIIISTGIAELNDIDEAINACKRMENEQIVLLKCVSLYPTPLDELNLKTIVDLDEKYNVVVGLSDHSREIVVPIAAVALGAKVIESHLILDRNLGGPDAQFSLEPEEFKIMVSEIRKVEKSLGKISYELSDLILQNKQFARSLFVIKDIKAGEILTENNVKSIRPGNGLHPKYLKEILGRKIKQDTSKGMPLNWELIE